MSDDIALVLYSSGTTGRAKGIMLSHRAINENANAIINYMSVRDDDVFAIIKNLEHSSTIIGEVIVAIKCGCPIVLVDNHLSISMILENLYRSKATITCMNPTILALFMRMAPSLLSRKSRYLRKIYISGAILNKELMINAKKKLRHCNLFNVYGMTECGPRISSQELSTHTNNNSVGKPIVGVRLRILDENGNVIKKSNTIGSIEVNTPYRAQGYVNGHTLCSDNYGWIKTGDNGYFDKNGDLYIVGRIDNMLNVYGHNVYPESIEEVIQKINGVEACLVTGIRNEILGCTLCCYYIGKLVTNQQIYEHCKQYLHTYEIPRKYVCVDSLQYSNGKIVRKQFDNISVIEK